MEKRQPERGSVFGKQMEWSGKLSRHRTQCQGQEPGGHCGHQAPFP